MDPTVHPVAAYAAEIGLAYEAEFVPFSKSRNAKPDPRYNDFNLNWRIHLRRNGRTLTTDYMQGVGHIPGAHRPKNMGFASIDNYNHIQKICETGKSGPQYSAVASWGEFRSPLPP